MISKLYIKSMVCDRCKMLVTQELTKAGIAYTNVNLGEVELSREPSEQSFQAFRKAIESLGFELIEDKNSRIISKIKSLVIQYVKQSSGKNFSDVVTENLNKEYSSLSSLFSDVEGITLERYIILQRIERVKELMVYDELSLSQIADKLGYSSINHLSTQFKKITGLSPSHFKKVGENKRISLDKVGL